MLPTALPSAPVLASPLAMPLLLDASLAIALVPLIEAEKEYICPLPRHCVHDALQYEYGLALGRCLAHIQGL